MDYNSAMIASVLAEINRDKKKKPKPFTLDDFLLDFRRKLGTENHKKAVRNKVKNFLAMIGAKKVK